MNPMEMDDLLSSEMKCKTNIKSNKIDCMVDTDVCTIFLNIRLRDRQQYTRMKKKKKKKKSFPKQSRAKRKEKEEVEVKIFFK